MRVISIEPTDNDVAASPTSKESCPLPLNLNQNRIGESEMGSEANTFDKGDRRVLP
jgi:hypothetical protein